MSSDNNKIKLDKYGSSFPCLIFRRTQVGSIFLVFECCTKLKLLRIQICLLRQSLCSCNVFETSAVAFVCFRFTAMVFFYHKTLIQIARLYLLNSQDNFKCDQLPIVFTYQQFYTLPTMLHIYLRPKRARHWTVSVRWRLWIISLQQIYLCLSYLRFFARNILSS